MPVSETVTSETPISPSIASPVQTDEAAIALSDGSLNQASAELSGADFGLHRSPGSRGVAARPLIWIMTLASLGLHALVVFIPMPSEPEPPPAEPEEMSVRITQLPAQTQASPGPTPQTQPTPRVSPPPRSPVVQQATTAAIPQPSPAASPTPQSTPSPPADAAPPAPANGGNPWQDFPLYPGGVPGCYNLSSCIQTNASLEDVSSYFQRELTAKQYSVNAFPGEANRRVYQVSRNGLTQFLTLFFVEGKTIYVLSEAPRTLADLGQAVEVPTALYDVLANFAAQEATRADFAQPDAFYQSDALKPGIAVAKLVTGEAPDTFFDTYLRTNLFNSGFASAET
ncbi:MAG TPA: hypothetical protein V6C88_07265, partial [Chroococcidiopsis sp.]